ncbi:uncharacterized protein LODBEIA_P07550 [Lodderomyces beijingensis]|uniref:Ornithine cyclodeaminase n=1 Tax=Lodderomyces beijingensis TaxID=1775926 RepID=A0ABP0ZHE8_9ASCO
MKVITDGAITGFLNKSLTKKSILEVFQPALLNGLVTYSSDPEQIVPPRIKQASNNPNSDTVHVYMPCISPNEVGIKVISGGPCNNSKGLGFVGCVLIMDEISGELQAVMNASTLTAFRTALASTLGLIKVISVDKQEILPDLTVFGVGAQAYWHVKLSLLLYGRKIQRVNILNRTLGNAEKLKAKLEEEFKDVQFDAFSFQNDGDVAYKNRIQNSSIIFGCTPAASPVIKAEYINKDPKWPVFISLIGSYKPDMIELDLDFVKKLKQQGVKIIVDSKEHTLEEAGELIQSQYQPSGLVEIHELYTSPVTDVTDTNANVTVQKIVGLSIMDLAVGKLVYEKIGSDAIDVTDF